MEVFTRESFQPVEFNFWTEDEWDAHEKKQNATSSGADDKKGKKGKTRLANDENVRYVFVEDAKGVAVKGGYAGKIREGAYQIFLEMRRKGVAPATWTHIDAEVLAYFRYKMELQFPELRYCANHWKADKVGALEYNNWRGRRDKADEAAGKTSRFLLPRSRLTHV